MPLRAGESEAAHLPRESRGVVKGGAPGPMLSFTNTRMLFAVQCLGVNWRVVRQHPLRCCGVLVCSGYEMNVLLYLRVLR